MDFIFLRVNQKIITMTNSLFLLAEGGLFDFNATLPLMALQILLLMVVLNSLFYTPIAKVLDERDKNIRDNLTQAADALAKAEAITKQYEEDLAKERRDAQMIIASSQKEAQQIVAQEIEEAQRKTEELVKLATTQLNSQKEKALQALEKQVNTLSEQIKNKLLSDKLAS